MRNVLADLALESEAATALMLRLARAFDGARATRRARLRPDRDRGRQVLGVQARAARDLRGDGVPRRERYVEEAILARLYREAPRQRDLGGLGQRDCLDVLRAMVREPETLPALLDEIAPRARR